MPKFEDHVAHSEEQFGESGEEYHEWIDQYAEFGYRHRQVLHNKEGIEVGVQLFGERARKHLELHIKDDYELEKIPTIKDLQGYPRATDGLKERKREYTIQKAALGSQVARSS